MATSLNMVYAVRASPSPKCSALPRTSHTPIPLSEIARRIKLSKKRINV